MIEYASDIIFILTGDGRIIDANRKAVQTYGYGYDELLKMHIFNLRDPLNLKLAEQQFAEAKIDGVEFETVHFRKDGSSLPVEVKSIGIQVSDKKYIASIIRDISSRRKREEEIRTLASIVESSNDAIMGTTTTGIITGWNKGAEKLYGYTKKEILGLHGSVLIPQESRDNINEIIEKVKNNERVERYEAIRKRKDGRLIHVAVSVSPMYNSEGGFEGISSTTRDLTEKDALTRQLNEHEERWRHANELNYAHAFQSSLMSDKIQFDLAGVYGKYIPSSVVGGDLYDCIELGNSLWFIIADVTGHGLVAAMVSTMIKGLFNSCIQNATYPNEVLEAMNRIFLTIPGDSCQHMVSAFVGVIRDNTLYYSNAGHPYPVIINCKNKTSVILEQNGFLLGMWDSTQYGVKQAGISQNDMILLYTDGLFDFRDTDAVSYWDKISEFALKNLDVLENHVQSFIVKLLDSFIPDNKSGFEDDVSVMIIRKS